METTELKTLERCFNTSNEHWNTFAYAVHCKCVEQGLFEDAALPIQLIERAVQLFECEYDNPTKAVQLFLKDVAETEITLPQQLFVFKWIDDYLSKSEFDNDLTLTHELLKSHTNNLKRVNIPVKPLVSNIRETLKGLIEKELKELPQTLKDLEPEKRLNVICKLIPYVLPKVEAVSSTNGEPGSWT